MAEKEQALNNMAVAINDALYWYADARNYEPQQEGKYHAAVIYENGTRARRALEAMKRARDLQDAR